MLEHGSDSFPGSTVSLELVSGPDGIVATVGDGGRSRTGAGSSAGPLG